jgi:hypothetical protein
MENRLEVARRYCNIILDFASLRLSPLGKACKSNVYMGWRR